MAGLPERQVRIVAALTMVWCLGGGVRVEADPSAMGEIGQRISVERKARAVVGPSVAMDAAGRVALSWVEETNQGRAVLFSTVDWTTGTIAEPVRVNGVGEEPYARQEAPALVVAGDEVLVTWALVHPKLTPQNPFANELRLSRSHDGGRTFQPSVLVNDDDQVINHSFDSLHLAADGTVHIGWIDAREGQKQSSTYATRSLDGGRTVAANQKVDDDTCVCCRTALTSGPDGTVYLAWRKVFPGEVRETVVARSTDGGQSYGASVVVGQDRWVYPSCPHRPASLGTDRQGRLYVVWYTEGADETPAVYLAYSDDRGETFSPKRQLNNSKGTFPDHPQLAVDPSGRLVVAWEEQSPVRREVVARMSIDRGESFSAPVKLNEKKGQTPAVAVGGAGQAVLAWMEHAMPHHRLVVQRLQVLGRPGATKREP